MIPRIIHQIWIQGADQMPDEDRTAVESIKNLNPDWQHILWDNDSITELLTEYPEILYVYNNVDRLPSRNKISDWGMKGVVAKFVIAAKYGGCYMDTDVKCISSLNTIVDSLPIKGEYVATGKLTFMGIKNIDILSGQFFISTVICRVWDDVFDNILNAKTKEKLDNSFTDAFIKASVKDSSVLYILPKELLTMYHCGCASICMIPIKLGATEFNPFRTFLDYLCRYRDSIFISMAILILYLGIVVYIHRAVIYRY